MNAKWCLSVALVAAVACSTPAPRPNPLLTATGPDLVVETWRMRLALDCPATEFDAERAAELREALADPNFDHHAFGGIVATRLDRSLSGDWAAGEADYQREFGSMYGHCPASAFAAGIVDAGGFHFAVGAEYGP